MMKFLQRIFLKHFLVFALVLVTATLQGQSIWENSIDGTNPATANPFTNGDVNDANITVSGIGRGSGINANAGADRYNATGYTTASAIDANDYFTFTLTPKANYKINFDNFVFTTQRSSSGPVSGIVKSSLDNYNATIGAVFSVSTSANATTITLTDAAYQNIASAITFRVYLYRANAGSGTASINDFTFNGTVSGGATINMPTPSSLAFGNVATGTSSAAQSFSVTGSGLSSSISVSVPSPYQVSTNSTTGFTSNLNLASSGGTVYVRFSPTVIGSQPATVTLSATGATNKTVSLTGTGVTPPSITTTAQAFGPFCNGTSHAINVAFTTQGTFDNSNFSIQLSNENGVFANTITNIIGSGNSSPINASLPSGLTHGNYRVRALQVSNSSVITFSDTNNDTDIVVNAAPTLTNLSQVTAVCSGNNATIQLTGLRANTEFTVSYTINNAATQQTVVTAAANGTATFEVAVTHQNNGQELKVTGLSTPDCSTSFNATTTLNVSTNTWTGTANNDWNNAANWSCGVVPTITTPAIIANTANPAHISGAITANAARLKVESGATLLVTANNNLNLAGDLEVVNGGNVTFQHNSNLIQTNDITNQGIITMHRNSSSLYNLDYTIWSSPTHGTQTLKSFSPNTLDDRFYVYNTAVNAYSNYTSTSGIFGSNPNAVTFTTAKGYLIRMPDGLPAGTPSVFEGTFSGTPNNGSLSIALNTSGNRYNAVGNPYPSPINVWNLIDANTGNLDNGTLYFWRKTNNPAEPTYATLTKLAYNANTAPGGDTGSATFTGDASQWVINPGQGFFVKAAPTAGNLVFNNGMRRAVNNNQFFRTGSETVTVSSANSSRLWLNITGSGSFGQTVIGYTNVTTNDMDYGWDGVLLNDGETAIYSKTGTIKLAIQARATFQEDDVVPVSYKATNGGNFTLSLHQFDGLFQNQDIYLKDKTQNSTHNLKTGSYAFATEAGTFENRFEILYRNTTLGIDSPEFNTNNVIIYKQNNSLHINGGTATLSKVKVFDISGRLVYENQNINATTTEIQNMNVAQQVLIVQVTNDKNETISKKIIY